MGLRQLIVICSLGAVGCYSAPTPPAPRPALVIGASMGRTWDAVIEEFAEGSIPIRTLERASGLIVTDPMAVGGSESESWAECAGGMLIRGLLTSGAFNVLVRGDSGSATVKVTARWLDQTRPCVTTGVWESSFEQRIKHRAEAVHN